LDTVVDQLVSFLQAVTSGTRIGHLTLIVLVLIGLAWIIAGLVHRRILNERYRTASKAQKNFEAAAAELRKRALTMKQGDDELWNREQEVTPRDEPKAFEDTDANLRPNLKQSTQQRALSEQLKQSVGRAITIGFRDHQDRLLQSNLGGLLSAAQRKRKKAA
jgi:ABC-type transport system involved in cytochrome bd biosynthesis fused ATPase/permease subunit